MTTFLNALKDETNFTYTENGGITHKTTKSDLLDMFAMGAAMRNRSDEDVILMFRKAYAENPTYALKCLFYIRDIRGGQGERRFFRLCLTNLAKQDPEAMRRNIKNIPEYGRWDDLYALIGTQVEDDMWKFMKHQLVLDTQSKTPSLLAKWMKSENTSSKESKRLGRHTRVQMHMTPRQYRKTLSILRERINILERLMSAGRWSEIEFDKIPSKAGFVYKNAFARHDVERMIQNKNIQSYKEFIQDETKRVNAKDLYPYEIVGEAINVTKYSYNNSDTFSRTIVNKYWDNYLKTFDEFTFNGIAVVDTSASMLHYGAKNQPMNIAISLGMCCAEKAKGPYHNHFITFSHDPQLIEVEGVDFVDKVKRIYSKNICENTNIKGVFDLILNTAIKNNCTQEDIPENIIIISDMEFDSCARPSFYGWYSSSKAEFPTFSKATVNTELEKIAIEWGKYGYTIPNLIFWNVDARQNNIPMIGKGASFVSGMSPSIYQTIATGKTGYDLMMAKLDSPRYEIVK